jgi:NADPH:quinone reductase-like Zn-dependent oxidoreductase
MKAVVYHSYGSPDVLAFEEIEKPTPGDDQVLIKVCAASVNPLDWHLMSGTPYLVRIMGGLRKPKASRLGADVAGRVEAIGRTVTQFRPGDEVFGTCDGAFAEYVCAAETSLAIKPRRVTFEQAASVPVAAFTALQGLRDEGRIQPGQKVLINGAAGGVGTFAVQLAKSFGVEVTGVCSTNNVDFVRSIGADHVIDYTKENFTKGDRRYDLIFDCIGNHSLLACLRVMSLEGIYVPVGAPRSLWMIDLLIRSVTALVLSRFVSQRLVIFFLSKSSREDLALMGQLLEAGTVTPVIDRRYGFSELPDAIRYLEEGHARGKVVITFDDG